MPSSVLVLDCETLHSASQCATCLAWDGQGCGHNTPIGWRDYQALGLSIGCAYAPAEAHWTIFDGPLLVAFLSRCVAQESCLVTFNGRGFDLPLLCRLVQDAETLREEVLALPHYDILHAIWQVDPVGKFTKGNSLDAVSQANGLPAKTGHGALAPQWWAAGQVAEVINYCMHDVWLTYQLYDKICRGEPLARGGDLAPVTLPLPAWEAAPLA